MFKKRYEKPTTTECIDAINGLDNVNVKIGLIVLIKFTCSVTGLTPSQLVESFEDSYRLDYGGLLGGQDHREDNGRNSS